MMWLYPVLKNAGIWNSEPQYLPLVALGLYVVGMMIDFAAWVVTRPIKHMRRASIAKNYGIAVEKEPGEKIARDVNLTVHAPELARASMLRSSRDRIARGAFVNSIFATVFGLPIVYGVSLIVFTFIMWLSYESVSYKYELKAEQTMKQQRGKQ
jgi:hypothetical protein